MVFIHGFLDFLVKLPWSFNTKIDFGKYKLPLADITEEKPESSIRLNTAVIEIFQENRTCLNHFFR